MQTFAILRWISIHNYLIYIIQNVLERAAKLRYVYKRNKPVGLNEPKKER